MSALSLEAVEAEAIALAGLARPDTGPFRANLELLVDCLNAEARLKAEALPRIQHDLALALRNRLEVSEWLTRYPEIRDEPVEHPIFLTGLPRSGTTYFQYLFDPEPGMRMLRYWEGQRTCPPPGHAPETVAARIAECAEEKARASGDPLRAKIAQIHLSDADGPEECLKVLDQTFANVGHYWTYRVPSYFARCLDGVDLTAAYAHHKAVLQLLQWQGERRRWVLKWPCHLVALGAVLDVYPDARFVITHRDPVQALASNCSLAAMLRRATSLDVDLHEVGRQMRAMIRLYLDRLVAFDKAHGQAIAHVDYTLAVEHPEQAVAQSFATLGLEMTPATQAAIVQWRAENPPGKRGSHDYALEDYGLDADEVAEEYAFYSERFGVLAGAAA